MPYVDCLHCSKTFPQPSTRRYCSTLCKNAVDKQAAKLRLAEDRHHQQSRRTPTFDLTDVECLAIEARLAGSEVTVFDDYRGFNIKDAHQETGSANANELHDSWASKGAALDVWAIRRKDRARFGGIVYTPELAEMMELAKINLGWLQVKRWLLGVDGLDSLEFHNKLFGFELDELYELETGDKA